MTHVRTSPYYPQSNRKIERWHNRSKGSACVLAGPDLAVLSYNLVNYFPGPDGSETEGTRWNSTQVYRRAGDQWHVIHVHWSFTKHPAFDNITVQG